ncbi:MAG: M56 family metallopeptidase [Kofleriaceae bacterium]
MSAGALVGFGALAVILVTVFSASATAIVAASGVRRSGPAAERSAAAWALLAPVALALAIVVTLGVLGAIGDDHCVGHDHHAHFCLVHGAAWLERPWAVVVAVAASATFLARIVAVIARRWRAARAIRQVQRVADRDKRVRIAISDRVFCFVAGHRPEIFVSSRAWDALGEDERDAMIAHERAHIEHGDLWLGPVVEAAAVVAAPLCGSWLRARWSVASEQLCDTQAATATSPETVASALVRLCRAGHAQHVPAGFTATGDELDERVRAVLADAPTGERLGRRAWGALFVALATIALLATPLHHLLETLLG